MNSEFNSLSVKSKLSLALGDGWTLLVGAIALILAIPVLFILGSLIAPNWAVWGHLASTVLPTYLLNSCGLLLGVGIGVIGIGVGTAWLVTMCRFPGSSILEWALLLPLAAPAYILAYVYTEILDYYGPVQTPLRQWFGWRSMQDYWFPDIRSLGGSMVMLILVLYPYVYLLVRTAFLEQSVCTLEASRSLGCSPWQSFFKVALPLARPAIAAGTALALMETLSDFGTVQYFGVSTFTTGIYRTWFGMGERIAACQLAALLMVFVLGLILMERWFRRRVRFYQANSRHQQLPRYELSGFRAGIAALLCGLPVILGFLLPSGFLIWMAVQHLEQFMDNRFWTVANHSLILSILSAGIGVAIALLMAYGLRLHPTSGMILAVRIAAMGYAIPGSVIAVGILVPMGRLDNALDATMKAVFGLSTGLLFSGTILALLYAYLVRFLAVSFGSVEASLGRIKPNLDDAARCLGCNPSTTLAKVHAPLMTGGLLTAAILVFVDVMKELPATLIIRPFNFDTLAIEVYQLASDERLAEAAAPALAIVLVGILPVMLLSWQIRQTRTLD